MKSHTLPPKIQTAIDVLRRYEVASESVAPPVYRAYLRFRPSTPPPLWDASPGYWTFLAFAWAVFAGTAATTLAAIALIADRESGSESASSFFFLATQLIGWVIAGVIGAVLAHETRRGYRREGTALGLPAWDAFGSEWRPDLSLLRSRALPERFWLRSLWSDTIANRAKYAGLLIFSVFAWLLPMKAGSYGEAATLAYLVVCLVGVTRTMRRQPMPENPWVWKCANGFWVGISTAAVCWSLVFAGIFSYPPGKGTVTFAVAAAMLNAWEWLAFTQQKSLTMHAERAEQERQLAEVRLQTLKAQIEPHFIFNTMAHLKSLIATDAKTAERMADELSDFLRASLQSLQAERVTLKEDFELVRAYLEIAKLRMGGRLTVDIRLPDSAKDVRIPPLMLLTLVENAVQHGIEPKAGPGFISVSAEVSGGATPHVAIRVADDGAGFGQASSGGSGVGLANVRERLASAYAGRAELKLSANVNAPHGVVAELQLPMEKLA